MSVMQKCHQELDEHGIGKCSVPMWMGGLPAGFCDQPAYGERPSCETLKRADGTLMRLDGRYEGYIPGLACPHHGGPTTRVFRDGDTWCAVLPDFINLQESPAGYAATPEDARAKLERSTRG